MNRGRRRVLWVLLGLGIVAVFGLAALRWLSAERLGRIVAGELAETLQGRFAIGGVWLDATGRVHVEAARVTTPEGEPVLAVEHASGRVGVLALLRGEVQLEGLRLRGVNLSLLPARAGEGLAIAQAFAPRAAQPPSEGGMRVHLRDAMVEGLIVNVQLPGGEEALGPVRLVVGGEVGSSGWAFDGRLDAERLAVQGIDFTEVVVQATVTPTHVTLQDLRVRQADGSCEGSGSLSFLGSHALALQCEAWPLRTVLSPWLAAPPPLPRTVSGRVRAEGAQPPWRATQLEADVALAGMPVGPRQAVDATVQGRLHLAADTLVLHELTLRSEGALVRAAGQLPLTSHDAVRLHVTAQHGRLARLLRRFGFELPVGRTQFSGDLSGSWQALRGRGQWTQDVEATVSTPAARLRLPWQLGPRELIVRGGELTTAGGRVAIAASLVMRDDLGTAPLSVTLTSEALEIAPLCGGCAQGRATLVARARGSLSAPVFDAQVTVEELLARGVALRQLDAQLEGNLETLRANVSLAVADGGSVDGQASFASTSATLDANVRVREVYATSLLPLVPSTLREQMPPVEGRVTSDVRAYGKLNQLAYEGAAEVREVTVGGAELGTLQLSGRGGADSAEASVGLHGPAGDLRGEVTWRERELRYRLRGRALRLATFLRALPAPPEIAALVDIDLEGSGATFTALRLEGTVWARELVVAGEAVGGDITIAATPAGREGFIVVGDLLGAAKLRAHFRPGSPRPIEAQARFANLKLHDVWPALAARDVQVTASGEARFDSSDGYAAALELSQLQASIGGTEATLLTPARLSWRPGTLRVDRFALGGREGRFEIAGRIGAAIDINASGVLDLAIIAPFVPALAHASGAVDVALHVQGALPKPELAGRLSIARPLALRLRQLGRDLEIASGEVRFSGADDKLRAEIALTGELDGGAFKLEGGARLLNRELEAYALHFTGQNLPLRTQLLFVEANADVQLSGDAQGGLLAGHVDVVRGRYLRKFELQDFNFVTRAPPSPPTPKPAWLRQIALDLMARSESSFEVRVDAGVLGIELLLSSDVHIAGTLAEPTLEGRIESSRGSIAFPKATLALTQSVIEFAPMSRLPQIDLRAEGEVEASANVGDATPRTYFVSLGLRGDMSQMALELDAEPALDRLEVLALLVSGEANLSALAQGGDGGGNEDGSLDAALAFAGSQLTGPLSNLVEGQLERRLNLRVDLAAEVTSDGLRLVARQDLTRRLKLEGVYERSLAEGLSTTSASARLFLTRRLFFEGTTASATRSVEGVLEDEAQSRLELKWRVYEP